MTRLLLDQNLSPRLVDRLHETFDVAHVRHRGLAAASDDEVWRFARENGLAIVTKDADFEELAILRGAPPKVVWLRLGNCSTSDVDQALRRHAGQIEAFLNSEDASIFVIRR